MLYNVKKLYKTTITALELVYKAVSGRDYRALSHYILRINQRTDIHDILFEVSKCLKCILNYELFGFALKDGTFVDIWIDPKVYTDALFDLVRSDIKGQNIDYNVRYFKEKTSENRHHTDAVKAGDVVSYLITDDDFTARLYILPRRKMFLYHHNILQIITRSINIALKNSLNIKSLENAAAVDPLTNCYNRRALSNFLEKDIAYARRHGCDLSVVMFDIDDFKKINDTYGHHAGDVVLKEVSRIIASAVRKSDYLVRYGGEEFVLVLADTPLRNAAQLAEKLRKKISRHKINIGDATIHATASFGVACTGRRSDAAALVREADEMLYIAKAEGKNTVAPGMGLRPAHAGSSHAAPILQFTSMYK